MATHQIGPFKINTSEDGIAFRVGDGKIHRLGLGKKRQPAAEGAYGADAYVDDDAFAEEAASGGYSGRFAAAAGGYGGGSDYADDDYAADDGYDDYADDADGYDGYDDGYADDADGYDDYADDGYDDGYADDADGYDGGYADDDYGDGYADGGYGDGGEDDYTGGDYDDRYSDEDADGYDEGAGYAGDNPVLRYIDENDWVTYLLLVLLPPLGIYLLWRRRRFEMPIRWGVSIASAIWFIIMLILLISMILSGGGDTTTNRPITMNTPTPTIAPATTPSTDATEQSLLDSMNGSSIGTLGNANPTDGLSPAQTGGALNPSASPTPLAGYDASSVSAGTVKVTATGPYYHNNANCPNLEQGVATSNLTEDVALQRGKTPCPLCYPGQEVYYSTANGKYYHSDSKCSNMKNPTPITKEAAEKKGQTACPVCIQKTVQSLSGEDLRFVGENDKDQSGINVWATKGGRYYHTQENCSNMKDAQSVGLLAAIRAGKTACPTCASTASRKVWCTKGGKMFHNKSDCSNMRGAFQVTLAEALIMGKARCDVCWGNSLIGFAGNGAAATTNPQKTGGATTVGGTVYVYATEGGTYYHTNATCSGMTNAKQVTLSSMIKAGRKPCPTCASGANTTVYATQNGQYYHSYATCSGMTNAVAGTQAQAMAVGKQKCPVCWQTTTAAGGTSNLVVYGTKNGTYYHTNPNCSGMKDAVQGSLAAAVRAGKTACPTCAKAANRTVYSTDNGQYYHANATCSGMQNAKQRTLQEALIMGQTSCPECLGNVGIDGSVNGISDVSSHRLNVSSAKKSATSGTTAKSSGTKKAVSGVSSKKASGSSSSKKLSAVAAGKIQSSRKYTAGASGIKVYATASGKYYHAYKQHAGSGAKQVSIETAMNYGKKACPTCLKVANTTVYAVRGGRYYHRSKSCAGSGAVSGKLATALASGLDACPVCVTHTRKVTSSNKYKSGASGIKVYATASGKYFHTSKSCAGSNASHITLEKALNYGKSACPNCARAAAKRVYTSASDKYYHASSKHAGSGASSGYWAIAMAMGKKACPVCILGSEAFEESDVKYPAAGDTRVYIDTGSSRYYYHKSSHCGDGGLSNGTAVTLDFALGWGFKACPYCNPPTSIK